MVRGDHAITYVFNRREPATDLVTHKKLRDVFSPEATLGLVAGRVKIDGIDVAATNTPFSTIFKLKLVGAEQEPVMPEVLVTAVGYKSTLVDTGF